jgi:tricorn protease
MKRKLRFSSLIAAAFLVSSFWLAFPELASAQNEPSGGMMRYPDVSEEHIVFVYANDLWIVDREGGTAMPLASPAGSERFPRFSPDGKSIAFSGNYEGDTDIYVVPTAGGVAERWTYHPANETVCDWTPDGKSVLYSSNGMAGLGRISQLFTISLDEPLPKQLPVPYGTNGAISEDKKWLAYTPHSRDGRTWKRYRGGMASDIWLYQLKNDESKKITEFEGTDSLPMWHDSSVYYLSDGGEEARLNIWKYDTKSEERNQVTDFDEFDCKWPSVGPGADGEGEIVFSVGSELRLLNLKTEKSEVVNVTIPGDRPKLRRQKVDASEFISAGDISPSAKRVCLEARGDIWTLPAEKGTPRNLTKTNDIAERSPSWSPDGRWIAYFGDETGEYELYVTQSDGRGETKQLTEDGECFRYNPNWSPDSKHIVFTDKTGAIYLHTIDGETKLVDTHPFSDEPEVSWAQDSNWLTYSLASDDKSATSIVYVYNVTDGERHQITSGFFNSTSPTFDREGDFIYFSSARAFNQPEYEDVGQSFIYKGTEVILAVPLRPDVELPMLPESDEEEFGDDEEKEDEEEEDEDEDEEDEDEEDEDEEDEDEEESDEDESEDGDDADPVSGSWAITLDSDEMPAEARNAVLTLELADDGSVTGTADTPVGEAKITEGSYDADSGELSLVVSVPSQGDAKIEATIDNGEIEGTINLGGQEFEFSGERNEDEDGEDGDDDKGDKKKKKKKEVEPIEIDFDGITKRIFQLPIEQGNFGTLAVNDKNQLIYARGGEGSAIMVFDMFDDEPEEKAVVSGSSNFAMTPDGKKLLVFKDEEGAIVSAAAGQKLDETVPTDGMNVMIDPRKEWKQVFTDAWRIERDFFYDPTMHGVDWEKVKSRYEKMLDDCTSRSDVGFVIGEMISELNVGHAYYRGGPNTDPGPDGENVGLLGCTFSASKGHYQVDTIFEGAEWDTDARNPLRAVGVNEGDFILEVNGVELTDEDNPYAAFAGLAGAITTLTVSDDATIDDDDKRVVIKPMRSDNELRFRHWIERNRKYIDEKTDGKVGYIYVVNTGVPGQNDLFRQYYGQLAKDALIVDDRWNGGGQIPTRFIELLNRPVTNYWAKRDGRDWTWPPDAHHGPKCMLINGMAGSGGDMFPYLFRQSEIGKLIGMRTWGGLVGISGNPGMIDGSGITAPTFAYYETDGTWGVEGHGVDPDIEVIDDPAEMVDGADPQMDAAIKHIKKELKSNAYKKPERPPYPDRSKGVGLEEDDK